MAPLDLANVEFRTVSSAPDRMEIVFNQELIFLEGAKVLDGQTHNRWKMGELIRMGDRWYLDENYFQRNPNSDLRSVFSMNGYCQIIKAANEQLTSAAVLPDANQDPSDIGTSEDSE